MADDFGGGLDLGTTPMFAPQASGAAPMPLTSPTAAPPAKQSSGGMFGSGFFGILGQPNYTAPDPNASPLDQTADTLSQRVKRANEIAANPLAQFFWPEQVQKARDFVPKATEQLQTIQRQKADMAAGRKLSETLGLAPGEVADEATREDRIAHAQNRAIKGDLNVFQGLKAVDSKAAEAIADQVHAAAASNLTAAQKGFDVLAGVKNQGEYEAALRMLRKNGDIAGLEALGLRVPEKFDAFTAAKGREAQALREARIGVDAIRQRLEDRNTAQPMAEAEAKTYKGAWRTVYGDEIEGQASRVGSNGARMTVLDQYSDPRKLGRGAVLANKDQRKEIGEEFRLAVPKEEIEKHRNFGRTAHLATHDDNGNFIPAAGRRNAAGELEFINTNPNVQQGIAEGLASMLRGGTGGANIGLMKLETGKRGLVQGLIDKINTEKAAVINELKGKDVSPYLSSLTQKQVRDVMDVLHQYTAQSIGDRGIEIAKRAGALGLNASALGLGNQESAGPIDTALEEGRQAQIALDMTRHQSIGGGRGALLYGALNPANNAQDLPEGTQSQNTLPGPRLQSPVQQSQNPQPSPDGGGPPGPRPGEAQPQGLRPGGNPTPTPQGAAAIVARAETGDPSMGQRALGNVSPDSGGSKSYGFMGLNSKTGSAQTFVKQYGEQFGLTARPGTPEFDKQWRAAAASKPDEFRSAQMNYFQNKYISSVQNDLTRHGVPAEVANDPRVQTYFVDRKVQMGDVGSEAISRAWERSDGDPVKFLRAMNSIDGSPDALQRNFRSALDSGVYSERGHANRLATRLQGALGAGTEGSVTAEAQPRETARERIQRRAEAYGPGVKAPWEVSGELGDLATEHAPAIGSTAGSVVGGALGGVPGAVVGGGLGGSAGQAAKDYFQGKAQSPTEIAKQGALGAVLGVAPAGGALARVGGAAARAVGPAVIEGGAEAAKGGDAGDIASAGGKGLMYGLTGEALGRFVSSAGHAAYKALSRYTASAQHDLSASAGKLAAAREVMANENPKLPGDAGPNPKYEAAKKQADEATEAIKDHGQNPDDMVHAYEQAKAGVSGGEAAVLRKAESEKRATSTEYNALQKSVQETGVGAPEANQPLSDGPVAQIRTAENPAGKVEVKFAPDAQHAEMLIKAPAPKGWGEKWGQLQDAGSELIKKRMNFLAAGDKVSAQAMDDIFQGVRNQQRAAARYVFGEAKGDKVIEHLENLDKRWARLMNATAGMDYGKMRSIIQGGNTPQRRELEKNFREFAGDDAGAMRAFNAMKARAQGRITEETKLLIPLIASETLGTLSGTVPTFGVISAAVGGHRLYKLAQDYANAKVLGKPVKFADFLNGVIQSTAAPQGAGSALQRAVAQ